MALKPAIFVDKDGTLVDDVPYNVDPERMVPASGVEAGLRRLAALGWPVFVVSNQPGIALGKFEEDALRPVRGFLVDLFSRCGLPMSGFSYCPHHPQGTVQHYSVPCTCRKPMPGLITSLAREFSIDLPSSWMLGDILNDVEAGHRAGTRSVLIDVGNETEWLDGPLRRPDFIASDFDEAARHVVEQTVDSGSATAAHVQ